MSDKEKVIKNPYNPFATMDTRIIAKEELLASTLEKTIDNNNVLLEYATGSGKSNNAIQLHRRFCESGRVLIVVAEILHYKLWEQEYIKFDCSDLLKNVKMVCYQSLHKEVGKMYDLVIWDECHRVLGNDRRIRLLKRMKAPYNIFLSATLTFQQKLILDKIFPGIKKLRFSLKDALEKQAINEYKIVFLEAKAQPEAIFSIYKLKSKLKKGEKYEQITFNDRFKPTIRPTEIKCTASQYIQYHVEKSETASLTKDKSEYQLIKFLRARLLLKNAISEVKMYDAKRVLEKMESLNKRFICFTDSIEKIKYFNPNNGIHSKKTSTVNSKILEKFQNKEINSLYVVGKLTEGINPKDVNIGIITQLDNNIRIYEQKSGRILRGESPVIYVLYLKGTLDEVYISNVTKNIDENLIKTDTVENFLKTIV